MSFLRRARLSVFSLSSALAQSFLSPSSVGPVLCGRSVNRCHNGMKWNRARKKKGCCSPVHSYKAKVSSLMYCGGASDLERHHRINRDLFPFTACTAELGRIGEATGVKISFRGGGITALNALEPLYISSLQKPSLVNQDPFSSLVLK